MLIHNYLAMTDDEYAVVKLTEKSEDILRGGEAVIMKLAKEQPHPAKAEKGKSGRRKLSYSASGASAGSAELSPAEEALFERLRTLRTEIARGEKVPPYIIFSDRTLVHMCMLKPGTKAEMLKVSGVGEYKYDKYGERFLDCIRGVMKKSGSVEA